MRSLFKKIDELMRELQELAEERTRCKESLQSARQNLRWFYDEISAGLASSEYTAEDVEEMRNEMRGEVLSAREEFDAVTKEVDEVRLALSVCVDDIRRFHAKEFLRSNRLEIVEEAVLGYLF